MRIPSHSQHSFRGRQRGATLIELMIALLLGLLVVAAASGLFLTNKRVYASTETINRIQENSRVAFEVMARDIREAGRNPCGNKSVPVSQLKSGSSGWWDNYFVGLKGYEQDTNVPGTTPAAGTDVLDVYSAGGAEIYVTEHSNPGADLDVTSVEGIKPPEILMVCNRELSLIFEATGANANSLKIIHPGGNSQNCTQRFRSEYDCTNGNSVHDFCMYVPPGANPAACHGNFSESPAQVARFQSHRWYVAENGRGGRSLYRATLSGDPAAATPSTVVEVAEGIVGMQLQYRSGGATAWQSAAAVADWAAVNAVQVSLTAAGTEGALSGGYLEGTDGNVLTRNVTHVVAIRNREGVL